MSVPAWLAAPFRRRPGAPAKWRHRALRLVTLLGFCYLVCLLMLALLQTKLIFPGSWTHPHHGPTRLPAGVSLVPLTMADGRHSAVLWAPAWRPDGQPLAAGTAAPTLLFFYGNGDWLAGYPEWCDAMRRLGLNVCVPEYPGYGAAAGSPSEAGCYAVAEAARVFVLEQPGVDAQRLLYAGWSLGSGVAVELATRHEPAGLLLVSAYTSIPDVAQSHYFFLPCHWLVRQRFDSVARIGGITCPIILIHGTRDRTVPYRMSRALRDAARRARWVEQIPVLGAGHNDMLEAGDGPIRAALARLAAPALSATHR